MVWRAVAPRTRDGTARDVVGRDGQMLNAEIVEPAEVRKATRIFHRDGFVVMRNALTAEQLAYARSGAERVIAEQTAAIPLEDANRGYAR